MMHFPLFHISSYLRKISRRKFLQNLTFSHKIFRFSSAKISDDFFLSHSLQISNFPPISLFQFISSPISGNYSFPLLLQKISPPDFVKLTCFYIPYVYISFPSTFTMVHVCITQCTYWTPLQRRMVYPES